ncbi:MAG: glutathione S-transferase family protein [Methyloligellaceae bacterium]
MQRIQERLELISFRICPFVMRAQITGLEKGCEFKTTYIDLANKPQWFLDQSPTGAVPAIKIDGYFIFESAVICDLIDDLTHDTLYPSDPVQKYYNKSWIDFASDLIFKQFAVLTAKDKATYDEKVEEILPALAIVEKQISNKPFWNGEQFSIIDAAYAPLLHRFNLVKEHFNIDYLQGYPKLKYWTGCVLTNSSVRQVCNEEFNAEYLEYLNKRETYLTSGT